MTNRRYLTLTYFCLFEVLMYEFYNHNITSIHMYVSSVWYDVSMFQCLKNCLTKQTKILLSLMMKTNNINKCHFMFCLHYVFFQLFLIIWNESYCFSHECLRDLTKILWVCSCIYCIIMFSNCSNICSYFSSSLFIAFLIIGLQKHSFCFFYHVLLLIHVEIIDRVI